MDRTLLRFVGWLIVLAMVLVAAPMPASAQACTKSDIAAVIDSTAATLRKLNARHQPELQAKVRQLGERRGWSEAERNAKAVELLRDDETRALDEQASKLLIELDVIGDEAEIDPSTCRARLEKLKAKSAQLIEITTAKAAHVSARVDAALNAPGAPQETKQPERKAAPKTVARADPPRRSQLPPAAAPAPTPRLPEEGKAPAPPAGGGWETDTVLNAREGLNAPAGEVELMPEPDFLAGLPPYLHEAEDLEYSVEEVRDAGRGLFGSISAGLASVIEYAFQTYGRPNGYILGSEGGAALLAGLRYGDGRLVTKLTGEHKVYWQGPSVGYDVGLAGSRVMFLVYNLKEPDDLFARFIGVDGSAYVVGGVGMTFLKKGSVVLAPIRTGLGLRVGANVGYLKFTPERSLNPF